MHTYDHDPRSESYGLEAASALNLDPTSVFKTLLADVDGSAVVAIVPVSGTLNLKLLAEAAGGRRAVMTEPAVAQRLTGYVVGGISPIGQRRQLRTFLDESALTSSRIYVSGGRRGLDLALAPEDLVTVTDAVVCPIARA